MRSPFCMLLTFALTLALSLPARAHYQQEPSCVNVSVNVAVSVVVQVDVSVAVTISDEGGVNLAWDTGAEPNTAGFNVYRADPGGPSYYKINPDLITTQPDPVSGGCRYTFTDWPSSDTSPSYMLESIGSDGKRHHRGFVTMATTTTP
jgi:hypothetical protein